MSCNIITFKLKKLENLRIPFKSFFKGREDYHPERTNNNNGTITLDSLGCNITGILEGETFKVSDIELSGEGSGSFFYETIEQALKDSKGILIASCVWEDGDISKLISIDGAVSWEKIDI